MVLYFVVIALKTQSCMIFIRTIWVSSYEKQSIIHILVINDDNELIIKGIYKDRPKYLFDVCQKIFSGDQIDRHELNKIYSNDYYRIIKQNNLDELFYRYYACDGSKYLSSKYKYEKIKSFRTNDIIPKRYLKLFIYPLMVI